MYLFLNKDGILPYVIQHVLKDEVDARMGVENTKLSKAE